MRRLAVEHQRLRELVRDHRPARSTRCEERGDACVALLGDARLVLALELSAVVVSGHLVGPDEETVYSFDGDEEFDLATVAGAYGGRRPAPSGFMNAFVEVSVHEVFEHLTGTVVCEGGSGFGSSCLVVLDRVLAIPHGTRFLEGSALARIPSREVAEVARGWARLVVECGGSAGIKRAVRPYFSPGLGDDCAAALRAIDTAFAAASAQKLDVLLFSCLP